MALSERLRQAQARRRRAEELPRYLERVRACTGRALQEEDLLTDAEVEVLIALHTPDSLCMRCSAPSSASWRSAATSG